MHFVLLNPIVVSLEGSFDGHLVQVVSQIKLRVRALVFQKYLELLGILNEWLNILESLIIEKLHSFHQRLLNQERILRLRNQLFHLLSLEHTSREMAHLEAQKLFGSFESTF